MRLLSRSRRTIRSGLSREAIACPRTAWAAAALLRTAHAGAPTVLIASVAVALCALTLLLRWAPRLVLGEDGLWMVQTLSSYLPDRMNPLQRFHLGIERT